MTAKKMIWFHFYIFLFMIVASGCGKNEKIIQIPVPVAPTEPGPEQDESIRAQQELNDKMSEIHNTQLEIALAGVQEQALKDFSDATTDLPRLGHAKRFYAHMPFQLISASPERLDYYKFRALNTFFTALFERYSLIFGIVRSRGNDPAQFRQLSALSVHMHYINPEQKLFRENPISFLDLMFELVDAHFHLESCSTCKVEDYPMHIRENLHFAGEAIQQLQIAHSALLLSAIRGIFDEPNSSDVYRHRNGRESITIGVLLKSQTSSTDIEHALERIKVGHKIGRYLLDNNVSANIAASVQNAAKPFHTFPLAAEDLQHIVNDQRRKLFVELVEEIRNF